MSAPKTDYEYYAKRDEVLSKFSEEFLDEHYNTDPLFREVCSMLMRDADPYTVIEMLVKWRKNILEQSIADRARLTLADVTQRPFPHPHLPASE